MNKSIDFSRPSTTFWNHLIEITSDIQKVNPNIVFAREKKDAYIQNCTTFYNEYKSKFMNAEVQYLDRHKEAAIFFIEGVIEELISNRRSTPSDEIFIGLEKILFRCAIDYILTELNQILSSKDSSLPQVDTFSFPKALSCNTKYIDIMCRNIYFFKTESNFNELKYLLTMELAEKFFLLEQISIYQIYGKEGAVRIFSALKEEK